MTLLGAAAWNIYRMFGTEDAVAKNDPITFCIAIVYQFILAFIISLSMKGHQGLLIYFGFLKGKMSKSIFLLFCATMVFPIVDADAGDSKYDKLNWFAAAFLSVCAFL